MHGNYKMTYSSGDTNEEGRKDDRRRLYRYISDCIFIQNLSAVVPFTPICHAMPSLLPTYIVVGIYPTFSRFRLQALSTTTIYTTHLVDCTVVSSPTISQE
jgi:hypothetical protein